MRMRKKINSVARGFYQGIICFLWLSHISGNATVSGAQGLLFSGFDILITDCDSGQFVEENGIVVVETESAPLVSGWSKEVEKPGYTGTAYYRWAGGNKFNSPGNGVLEYKIKINNPGTYHFRWHSKIMHGSDATESNDSWLRIPDADDFFAKKGSSVKYPRGGMFVQSNTTTKGSSKNGWMKVYSSGTTNWTWSCRTSDHDAHEIYAAFNNPGVYTVQISGRSNNHAINRFVLFKDALYSVGEATNKSLPESVCPENVKAPDFYTLTVNNGLGSGDYTEATTVYIEAGELRNKAFKQWTGDVENIRNVNASRTTIKMGTSDASITAEYTDLPPKYILSVNNGMGSGDYEPGETFHIVADEPWTGQIFDYWSGDTAFLNDVNSDTTRGIMPEHDISLKANYTAIPEKYNLSVNNGSGSGTFEHTDTFIIVADAPPPGQVFDQWTGDLNFLEDAYADTSWGTLPGYHISFTANYKDADTTTTILADMVKGEVQIYPNPAGKTVNVLNLSSPGTIQLISLTGEIVFSFHYKENRVNLNVSEIPSGIYMLSITKENNRSFIGKLMIQ